MGKLSLTELSHILVDNHSLSADKAEEFVQQLFAVVQEGLKTDKIVKIKGLGTFKLIATSPRRSVDVNTGKPIILDARDKITFTPETTLRDLVNGPFAQFDTVMLNENVAMDDLDRIDQKAASEDDQSFKSESATPVDPNPVQPKTTATEPAESLQNDYATQESVVNEPVAKAQHVPEQSNQDVIQGQSDVEASQKVAPEHEMVQEQSVAKNEVDTENQTVPPICSTEDSVSAQDAAASQISAADHSLQEPAKEPEMERSQTVATVHEPQAVSAPGVTQPFAAGEESNANDESEKYRELYQNTTRNKRIIYSICALLGVMVLAVSIGAFVLYHNLKARDARIVQLITEVNKKQKIRKPAVAAKPAIQPVVSKVEKPVATERNVSKDTVAAKPKEQKWDKVNQSDVRIRTGAYLITGIDKRVKVRKGQTLEQISHFYLGAGMECYVEAVNPGVSELTEGQFIAIPKLVLKKHRNK